MTELAQDTVVDGRYEIQNRIGSGGMADVYRARDMHLGREVALKILHRRFAQDQEFVERFKREASAAAGLQHANVVAIFDRGEYEGTYYIAMELLHGRTLKEIVDAEAPMDQLRAIELGIAILKGAESAHKHGVVHRDFKPHNVIVDDAGDVKVTDFGIARRGASEMTETGSIMGTAQYLSPEQAQGHDVAATSDVYSIGIILYELLSGRLPFDGDSAVSIALKHLSEPPPPMSGPGLRIEPNLENVVMGALNKDPAARWQSAADFAAALEACKPYVEQMQAAGGVPVSQDTAVFSEPLVAAVVEDEDEEEEKKRNWLPWVLGALLLALIGLLIWTFTRPEEMAVPKVTGLSLSDARDRLDKAGFENVQVEREQSPADVDTVLRQDPDPGEEAAEKDKIKLIVSGGPGKVLVPSVKGLSQERASKELDKAGLTFTADPQPSDTIAKGDAIGTSPKEGTEVDRNSRVRLFVSSGAEKVKVPDVVGLSRNSAEDRLDDEGLAVRFVEEESDAPEDEVIRQDPAAGADVDKGDRVTVTVSKGKPQVDVPNVVGLSEKAARKALTDEGLAVTVQERTVENEDDDGQVINQSPGAGVEVQKGRSVVITVGVFEETTPTPTPPATTPTPPPTP